MKRKLECKRVDKWQKVWNQTTEVNITKDYFPIVAERLNMKIMLNQHLTTIMTGHGNIKAYLYRFKLTDSPKCPCGKNDQTTDHLFECELVKTQRDKLRSSVPKSDGWPIKKTPSYASIKKHPKVS